MALYDVWEAEFHFSRTRSAQAVSISLEKQGFFTRVIVDYSPIIISEASNVVASVPFSGNCLEELCVFIAKFDPTNGASFFPILILIVEKAQQMFLEDITKVHLRG